MENAKNDASGTLSANRGQDTSGLSHLTAPLPHSPTAYQESCCQLWS